MFTKGISVFVFGLGLAVMACDLPAADKLPDEVQALGKATLFAFGGVGYAGTISPGEKLYRKVLESPQALLYFRMIVVQGTPEAKLYALCGIHTLDKERFEGHATSLKKADPTVTTMSGCSMLPKPASKVIWEISVGLYDDAPAKK
jgi:hypothetical protein